MKKLDLENLVSEINQFATDRDWDQYHSVKNLAMALSVETSELVELFQWLTEEESNLLHQDSLKKERLEDEVADILVYLLRIVSKSNIDLEGAVRRKLVKNAVKYPVELSKGNSKKYNEF